MTIFRKVDNLYRRSEEIHCVQLYKGAEIAKELREIGFRVKIIRRYGKLKSPAVPHPTENCYSLFSHSDR